MQELFELCHHTIFQSHLNQFVQALRLQKRSAWAIVRQELKLVLGTPGNDKAKPLHDFLLQDMAPYKCFMRMKMEGLYRDVDAHISDYIFLADHWQYLHRDVPNVILR